MSKRPNPPGTAILEPLATDEYRPPPRTEVQRRAADAADDSGADSARRVNQRIQAYWPSRRGTATGLLSLNDAAGGNFYEVPPEAAVDVAAAEEAFLSDGPVVDVQTHWIADNPSLYAFQSRVMATYHHQAPDWWQGLDGMVAYTMAEYLRCVFVESETSVAVISSTPGNTHGDMLLTNYQMVAMRELFDRMAGSGRLLTHTVVRPNMGDIELMPEWAAAYRPAGWKVYTTGLMNVENTGFQAGMDWRLDDEKIGFPFLEQARAVGVNVVCAHKGVSGLVASGSPSDVGPAAKAFPDINFLIYHSGYEPGQAEGPYTDATIDDGVNRLITSLRAVGLGPGGNVYAELGTTWFNLISRPVDAAHVLGKLLLHLGEDNIIWGTDAIWYGPTQPTVDAFRAFQIPDSLCEQYGYPKLTSRAKRKILAENAARVYGIDLATAPLPTTGGPLSWTEGVQSEFDRYGLAAHA
jgi:predicted TIM-barrel fold metal-dependent hydrolase